MKVSGRPGCRSNERRGRRQAPANPSPCTALRCPSCATLLRCTAGGALSFYSHFGKELQYEAIKLYGLFEIDRMSRTGHFR
jgi:hypothetical protein